MLPPKERTEQKMVNSALLKEQLKRFWPVSLIAAAAYFLGVMLPLFSVMGDEDRFFEPVRHLSNILTFGNVVLILGMVVVPLVVVTCIFRFYFSSKAATAFYSMPLNRNQLLGSSMLAGTILILLPLLAFIPLFFVSINVPVTENIWQRGFASTTMMSVGGADSTFLGNLLFPYVMSPGNTINTFAVVLRFFAMFAGAKLVYFGVIWLAHSISGHWLIAILVAGVLPVVPVGLFTLTHIFGELLVVGFNPAGFNTNFSTAVAIVNPVVWDTWLSPWGLSHLISSATPIIIWYFCLAAICLAAAFFVSRLRKPELTGNSIVFVPVKNLLIFLVSFMGMLLLAVIGLGILRLAEPVSKVMLVVFLAVGFAISYILAQMLAEKSLHIFHKLKYMLTFGGTAVGLLLAIWLITTFGMGFYVNRVPNAADVAGVSIDHHMPLVGHFQATPTDPEVIALTIAVHQHILDSGINRRALDRMLSDEAMHLIPITYWLTDGSFLRRNYIIPQKYLHTEPIRSLTRHEAIALGNYIFLQYPEQILTMWLTHSTLENHSHITITNQEQITQLSQAIWQDLQIRVETYGHRWGWPSDFWQRDGLSISAEIHDDRHSHGVHLFYPMENTMQLLLSWGYFVVE